MERQAYAQSSQPQYVSRKTLAIKRGDSETLTREDVQYDLLNYIFSDQARVFTDETPGKPPTKVNFCDLYVSALYNSTKCSKIMRDKMTETPAFAIEFAKISLLTNVGRINTTMAFFPEMKTALRSYHPVPSLQKTDGNVQDAPRIKNCLKAALLPQEQKGPPPPSNPTDILSRKKTMVPPTSVVNLIFVLTNYSTALSPTHFDPPVEFVDLFLPINISSAARARAFLWTIFHYHESGAIPNPFADEYAKTHLGKVPWLERLSPEQQQAENIDPPEEIEWGRKMAAQRSQFLQDLVSGVDPEKKGKGGGNGHHGGSGGNHASAGGSATAGGSRARRSTSSAPQDPHSRVMTGVDVEPQPAKKHRISQQYYTRSAASTTFHHYIPAGEPVPPDETKPYPIVGENHARQYGLPPEYIRQRSMVEQACNRALTAHPLIDSDEEELDEYVRVDLQRRLLVLDTIRLQPAHLNGYNYSPHPR